MKRSLTLLLLSASFGLAQAPPQPPPPPPDAPGPADRPFADMAKRWMDGRGGPLEQLNDTERQRLRGAMEKIWNEPAVKAARDSAAESARAYRDAMHSAALLADPSLAPVLEKMKGAMDRLPMPGPGGGPFQPGRPQGRPGGQPNAQPQGPPNGPPQGPPNGPDAGPAGGAGLRFLGLDPAELAKLPEAQRDQLRKAFEKISQAPDVKAARESMEQTPPEGKREAGRKLRDTIRANMEKEFPDLGPLLQSLRATARPEGNGPRPGGPNPPAPTPPPTGAPPPADTPGAPENAPPK